MSFWFHRRTIERKLENAVKNLLLWQPFYHSNRLRYYDQFFEQGDPFPLQKNPKYSQEKQNQAVNAKS